MTASAAIVASAASIAATATPAVLGDGISSGVYSLIGSAIGGAIAYGSHVTSKKPKATASG